MSTLPTPSLTAVCHAAVKNAPSGLGTKTIADLLGRDYNTMMSELSRQSGHKFGADLVLPVMQITGSLAPMNFLARQLGGVFICLPHEAGQNALVDSLLTCVREFGEFAAEAAADIADGNLPADQYMRICKEGQEAATAIMKVMELARLAYEAQNKP